MCGRACVAPCRPKGKERGWIRRSDWLVHNDTTSPITSDLGHHSRTKCWKLTGKGWLQRPDLAFVPENRHSAHDQPTVHPTMDRVPSSEGASRAHMGGPRRTQLAAPTPTMSPSPPKRLTGETARHGSFLRLRGSASWRRLPLVFGRGRGTGRTFRCPPGDGRCLYCGSCHPSIPSVVSRGVSHPACDRSSSPVRSQLLYSLSSVARVSKLQGPFPHARKSSSEPRFQA